MNTRPRYVCAFNRDRDFYQVPLALEEAGCLERLVTDLYVPDALANHSIVQRLRLGHRRAPGLPSRRVQGSPLALLRQMVGLKLARNEEERVRVFKRLDEGLSRQSLEIARRTGAGFFTYSGYALEAFSAPDSRDREKILFVFHPPATLCREILEADFDRHPEVGWSHRLHLREMAESDAGRVEAELRLADRVVCASSFTHRAIERVVPGKPVVVAPYGCSEVSVQPGSRKASRDGRPLVLFAGQGVQRKGLHHLLKAWKRRAEWGADLVVVAGKLDPGIRALAEALGASVRVSPPVSRAELNDLFARADILAMPSLIEGFGLVYLEAFAAGCLVLGTANTGLPDLSPNPDHVSLVPPGDIDALEAALARLVARSAAGAVDPAEVQAFARTRRWEDFRRAVCSFSPGA